MGRAVFFPSQLLKGVTIAAGGVLPNIHPELLAKKRGLKGKLEMPVSPAPEKKPKPVKKSASKKMRGKKAGAKPKVSLGAGLPPQGLCGEFDGTNSSCCGVLLICLFITLLKR